MSELSRRLALNQPWVYKPEDVITIFEKFSKLGKLDNGVLRGMPLSQTDMLIEGFGDDKSELLSIAYMCANNILPMLINAEKNGSHHDMSYLTKVFALDIFKAFLKYDRKPKTYLCKLEIARKRIVKDYYWDNDLTYLESQLAYIVKKYRAMLHSDKENN